jgi:hypothetical protein
MKPDAKSSITLPPDELEQVERPEKALGAKSKVEVIRRGFGLRQRARHVAPGR